MGMFSGLFGGGGTAKRAAAVQAAAYRDASEQLGNQYSTLSKYYDPYTSAGETALGNYMRLAGGLEGATTELGGVAKSMDPIVNKITSGNLDDFTTSPGYDFRMQEGQKALERSAAMRGTLNSGATGKALTRYAQDYGSGEYQNYLGGLYNQLNAVNAQLGGRVTGLNAMYQNMNAYNPIINTGADAANQRATLGMNTAQLQAGYTGQQGDAIAGGMMAKDRQMQNAGQQWVTIAGAAAGGLGGGMIPGGLTAGQGMLLGGNLASGGALGGMNNSDMFAQAKNASTSSYAKPQFTYGAYDSTLPWKQ